MKHFWYAIKIAAIAVFVILVAVSFSLIAEIIFQEFYPAGLETKSVEQAYAFLFNGSDCHDLPNKVEFTIDGVQSTFTKGTKPYIKLSRLLNEGRSDALLERAGPRPKFKELSHYKCGSMTISNYGIKSVFPIERFDENRNYYWIGLPKLTSIGMRYPLLTVDPCVVSLLRTKNAEQDAAANP